MTFNPTRTGADAAQSGTTMTDEKLARHDLSLNAILLGRTPTSLLRTSELLMAVSPKHASLAVRAAALSEEVRRLHAAITAVAGGTDDVSGDDDPVATAEHARAVIREVFGPDAVPAGGDR